MATGVEMMMKSLFAAMGISPEAIKEGMGKMNATAKQAGDALNTIVQAQTEILARLERIEIAMAPASRIEFDVETNTMRLVSEAEFQTLNGNSHD